jgi:hypothetical protein
MKNRTITTRHKRTGQNGWGRTHLVPIDKSEEKKRSKNNTTNSKSTRKEH